MFNTYIIKYKKHLIGLSNIVKVYNKHEADNTVRKLINCGFWVECKKDD